MSNTVKIVRFHQTGPAEVLSLMSFHFLNPARVKSVSA